MGVKDQTNLKRYATVNTRIQHHALKTLCFCADYALLNDHFLKKSLQSDRCPVSSTSVVACALFFETVLFLVNENMLLLFSVVEPRTQGLRPRPRTQKKSEAKAKDSLSEDRHSRGQGQECSRPRPRPRTKDTAASVFKKKGLQKSFLGNLQFIGAARIFDWGDLNHKSHAITSSKICLLALNQDFGEGRRLKLI